MEKDDNEIFLATLTSIESKTTQELEIYVFGATEGSLPQVMVPERGSEVETPTKKLMVILFILANLLLERRHKWKQTIKQPI